MSKLFNASELFENQRHEAEKIMNQPGKIDKLLKKLEIKLQNIPVLGDTLSFIPQMGMMVNSYIKGQYKEVPVSSIIAIIIPLLYFVAPIDVIPDFLPGVGLVDDVAVIGYSLSLIQSDLKQYMDWRYRFGLDKKPGSNKTDNFSFN